MIRKLLTTTALVTIAAGTAHAAEGNVSDRFVTAADNATMASTLIGESVYTSSAENAESVGDINDLLVGSDGKIDAAIVGVGGFLGLGEKDVAVSYDQLRLTTDDDGSYYVVLETSKEELEAAPEFEVVTAEQAKSEMKSDERAPRDQMAAADNSDATAKEPMAEGQMAAKEPMTDEAKRDQMAAMEREAVTSREVDRETVAAGRQDYAIVDVSTMGTDELIGANVYSYDNDSVGEIGEIILADDGKTDAVIIDVGGFLGLGEKPVAVAFEDLEFRADENGTLYVYTQFTEEQLESAREYNEEEYQQSRDQMRVRSAG